MKTAIYDVKGQKKGESELPDIFATGIREDIALKCFEALKQPQPYSNYPEAGKRHSASGKISHKRHDWKGHYGKGISRIPRKAIWRRGDQFFWIGAEISSTRGGRRSHPPRAFKREKKINKKEFRRAMNSVIAATADKSYILKRYSSMDKKELDKISTPIVIESNLNDIKTKEFIALLKNIFSSLFKHVLKSKEIRAGKGKSRNRKYKSNAGLLLVTAKEENKKIKFKGIDIKPFSEVTISDLYPLGRLAIYTEKALEELSEKPKEVIR